MTRMLPFDGPAGAALPDKRWVGRSFSRAASGYDRVAALQRRVGERLLASLAAFPLRPRTILDVGAGTGHCTARLAEMFPAADLVALDIAEGMLQTLRGRPGLPAGVLRVCGDGESLPVRDGSLDLVFSNLALQWCVDLPAALAGLRRALRPGGMLVFSTFGEATLCELREAWASVDDHTHVNAFASPAEVEAAMGRAGFQSVHVEGELHALSYPGVDALLRELKSLGAHNVTRDRPRHLTGKTAFRRMLNAYPGANSDGGVQASFNILYGRACVPGAGT